MESLRVESMSKCKVRRLQLYLVSFQDRNFLVRVKSYHSIPYLVDESELSFTYLGLAPKAEQEEKIIKQWTIRDE